MQFYYFKEKGSSKPFIHFTMRLIFIYMTKKQFFEKALRILRILNTVIALINWIF